MLVRKIRGQDRVGKITLSPTEVALAKKLGIPLEKYVSAQLMFIAKKRRWHWYLNRGKA